MNMVANLAEEVIVDTMSCKEDIRAVTDLLGELQSYLGSIDCLHEITVNRRLKESFEQMLSWRIAFVARYNGGIVGAAVLQIHSADEFLGGFTKHEGPLGEIEYLVVTKEYRGHGIGQKLIAASEKYFKEAGCVRMEISYLTNNVAAINLYTKLGYKPAIGTSQKMIPENF